MKKILRYGLWLDMIGWCLLLNNYEVMGILVVTLSTAYVGYFTKNINYWRVISVFLITCLINYFVICSSNLISIYHLLIPFLVVNDLNTALMNEVNYKIQTKTIVPVYLSVSTLLIVSLIVALIIPNTPILPYYKTNLLILIFLIFFPTFIEQSICVLSKSIRTHKQIQKLYN